MPPTPSSCNSLYLPLAMKKPRHFPEMIWPAWNLVVEAGPTMDVFAHPKHPYTWSLLRSIPRLDAERHEPLKPIEGLPPSLVG